VSSTISLVLRPSSCSFRYAKAMSAPSCAKSTATALPIPLSPPVIKATLFCNLSALSGRFDMGRGAISSSRPGRRCVWGGCILFFFVFFVISHLQGLHCQTSWKHLQWASNFQDLLPDFFLDVFFAPFFFGTFAPFSLASESPMAIA